MEPPKGLLEKIIKRIHKEERLLVLRRTIIFLITFLIAMGFWITPGGLGFDPAPFFRLNLMLSMLAGLQGSVLLVAAKRADKISAELQTYHLQVSQEMAQMMQDHKQMLLELSK